MAKQPVSFPVRERRKGTEEEEAYVVVNCLRSHRRRGRSAARESRRHRAVVVFRGDIFAIGLIEHQQHIRRQRGVQPGDLAARQERSGGVVGIGDEHHAGFLTHQGQQRIDIAAVIGIGGDDGRGPAAPCGDIVDREAIADIDHLVAHAGIGLRGEVEQFVGAGAHDDARGINAMQLAQRLSQRHAIGIGIAGGIGGMGARGEGEGAGAQRVLVGRELD